MRIVAGAAAYRHVLTATLALTVTVSYGVLLYAFPVMLVPMQAELGWSPALLTAGFSAAALAAGVAAIPVGRWIDRNGPRGVMTAGSAVSCVLLLAWSRVQDPASYLLVWIALGACMAAVFYDPAFTVVAKWFPAGRTRALTVITIAGGLASTIFVPLASWLVSEHGWRSAVACLALVLGALTILPHALVLRAHAPEPVQRDVARSAHVAGRSSAAAGSARHALRTPAFRWIGVAFFLATAANFALAVHLVPLLLDRGHSAAVAASALALLGLAKLPGRALIAPIAARASARTAIVGMFALQAVALVALGTMPDSAGMWIFVALFGAGDGAATPARAELLAEMFGSLEYGRICGALAFVMSLGRAAAPIGASLAGSAFGGYGAVLWLLAATSAAAALAMVRVQCPPALRRTPVLQAAGDAGAASFCGVSRLPA